MRIQSLDNDNDNDNETLSAALYKKAIDLLSRREHARFELQRKLYRFFSRGEEKERKANIGTLIEVTLDRVAREGFQSDFRFAEAYLYFRSQRGFGPKRIREELKQRGVIGDIITQVFLEDDQDWSALAEQVRLKRFGEVEEPTLAERMKQKKFLYYRGFCDL